MPSVRAGLLVALVLTASSAAVPPVSAAAHRRASCHGHPATIVGTKHADHIVGTNGPDVIVAKGGDDDIDGRGGHDIICAGGGADTVLGGAGPDVEWGASGRDTLVGGPGNDVLVSGRARNTLVGGSGNDVLVSSTTMDRFLFAGAPVVSDTHPVRVDLRAGKATGQGRDKITIKNPAVGAEVQVAAGSVVRGTDQADIFRGSGSTFFGRGGNDQFYGVSTAHGGPGNDYFEALGAPGSTRAPRLYGGAGNDQMQTSTLVLPDMVVDGGPGDDTAFLGFARAGTTTYGRLTVDLETQQVTADTVSFPLRSFNRVSELTAALVASSYELDGTEQADVLRFEGPAAVTVQGRGGDDVISTASRNDYIDGGDGTDSAYAGPGIDTCVSVEVPVDCETVTP